MSNSLEFEIAFAKKIQRDAVKEFAEKLKARLAKSTIITASTECIFNDTISQLLKEYDNE